ncbi:MAG: hypothetical protein Q7L55_08465 [Actinomycetota bacterium]|nr:hypothetical protein [Actinomycetota bacterium]
MPPRLAHEVGIVGAEIVEMNSLVDPGPYCLDPVKAGDRLHAQPEYLAESLNEPPASRSKGLSRDTS